jgi:hypothetical protein
MQRTLLVVPERRLEIVDDVKLFWKTREAEADRDLTVCASLHAQAIFFQCVESTHRHLYNPQLNTMEAALAARLTLLGILVL